MSPALSLTSANQITLSTFQQTLLLYPASVSQDLHALDSLRYDHIPELLSQRRKDGDAYLEKKDLTGLVEWKLKHGKHRPTLSNLIASNNPKSIQATTRQALAIYNANPAHYAQSLTELTKLKGVGPATASLILACYDQVNVPFFGDEVFEYLHSGDASTAKKKPLKIRYSMNEYRSLFDEVKKLRERLEREGEEVVSAVEVEKVAYLIVRGEVGGEGEDGARKEKDSARVAEGRGKGKRKREQRTEDEEESSILPTAAAPPTSTSTSSPPTSKLRTQPQRKKRH